jgi:hypothetical protein
MSIETNVQLFEFQFVKRVLNKKNKQNSVVQKNTQGKSLVKYVNCQNMAAELLDRINNSEKSLGFLFTKRDNTHLLELCDYIDSNDMDQLRKAEILDIDSRCAEDSEVIINNKRLVYQAI